MAEVGDVQFRVKADTQQATVNLGRLGESLKSFAKVAGALYAARTLAHLADQLGQIALQGSRVLTVQRSFNRVVGDGASAVAQLRRASSGLISDYDLMIGYNKALTLGSATTTQEFAELTKTALALGRALGVDAAYAMESLNLGIGRQSRLILDNLGLIVSVQEATDKYAAALGKNSDELSNNERRIAFRTAALEAARKKVEELGGVELNAGDKVKQASAAWTNLKNTIAAMVANSETLAYWLDKVATAANNLQANQGAPAGAPPTPTPGYLKVLTGMLSRYPNRMVPRDWQLFENIFGPNAGPYAKQLEQEIQRVTKALGQLEIQKRKTAAAGAGPADAMGFPGAQTGAGAFPIAPFLPYGRLRPLRYNLGFTAGPSMTEAQRQMANQVQAANDAAMRSAEAFRRRFKSDMGPIGEDAGFTFIRGFIGALRGEKFNLGSILRNILAQVLEDIIVSAIRRALAKAAAKKVVKGASTLFGFLPFLDQGGIVPGEQGQAQLAVVHGGERVIPNTGSAGILRVAIPKIQGMALVRDPEWQAMWRETARAASAQGFVMEIV